VDRDKDVIDPKGWRLASYRENPIVLWQHRRDLPPIARTTDIRVSGARLLASLEFPPEGASPLADEIHNLVAAGFLHSTSVGFLPIRSEYNHERGGHDILEAELLEWSIVNVPANHEALIQRCLGEACDRAAVDRWLKGAKSTRCACKTSLAEIPFVNGEFHFEDEHLYVTQSPATIARLTRGALRTAIKELIPQMIRREVNYMRGRID
jgi:HK97 family phage prohead protease